MAESHELLPVSALQHMLYCERQAALIHVARVWADNPLTVSGASLHETVDSGASENRPDIRVRRSMWLRSEALGLIGKADVVEFRRVSGGGGIPLPGTTGLWRPHPVEYKRGKPKKYRADEVQLCAQGLCLEEMLGVEIPIGFLYYGERRRRTEVTFASDLRELVRKTVAELRELVDQGHVPIRHRDNRCDRCSLIEVCMPPDSRQPSVDTYLSALTVSNSSE